MANAEHLDLLRQGVAVWNAWRAKEPSIRPNLREANLNGADLSRANLSGANLVKADLGGANLSGTNLGKAHLGGAILSGANLREAMVAGAYLGGANLDKANLSAANLREVNFNWAKLSGANLREGNLVLANLTRSDLSEADLSGANLQGSILLGTDFMGADLSGCRVYGVSAWGLKLERTKQQNLVITRRDEPQIAVDNIEVAQFVYLLLHNQKIRDIIDTVGKKGVLLLGRFTESRIVVLDRLRDELRKRGYLPIVFTVDKPETKDFTETVRLLAYGADDVLLDDLYGNIEDSDSPVIREKIWRWYTGTIYNRLEPGGSIILINHRSHEDDITARLIEKMQSGDSDADQWTIVKVPAICDAEDDPLGRALGEAAWPEAWPVVELNRIRATMLGRDWSALYQQAPTPDEGIFFSPDRIGVRFDTRNVVSSIRAWDLGGTATGDWTVGIQLGRTRENKIVVGDVKRMRGRWDEVEGLILETARGDTARVRIAIPVDPGQVGLAQKQEFVRLLAGFSVDFSPETGSKQVRARPFATQVNNFNVEMLSAPWNAAYKDELRSFPFGKFDDQVDASSRAFMVLMAGGRKSLAEINAALGGGSLGISSAGGSDRLARQMALATKLRTTVGIDPPPGDAPCAW
jgi:predicted phage terminase large subunit-like protein